MSIPIRIGSLIRARLSRRRRLTLETLEDRLVLSGFVFDESTLFVTEGRDVPAAALRVRLDAPPLADVTVTVANVAGDPSIQPFASTITIPQNQWDHYQLIGLHAAPDADRLDGQATIRLSAPGFASADALAIERDRHHPLGIALERDAAGLEITRVELAEGRTAALLVRLSAAPATARPIQISRVAGAASISVVGPTTRNFDSSNWERFQAFVLRAADDAGTSDDVATFRLTSPGLPSRVVTVKTLDDDVAGRLATHEILIDDYLAQPLVAEQLQGQTVAYYTRLGSDRGTIGSPTDVTFGNGVVEARVPGLGTRTGVFSSLNHVRDENLPLDLGALLGPDIRPAFQEKATAILIDVSGGTGRLGVELKSADETVVFFDFRTLPGGAARLRFDLPAQPPGNALLLNWFVEGAGGDFVRVTKVALETKGAELGAMEPFVWTYAALLANHGAGTHLTRDRANFRACESGNVSASGYQALAAVVASRLGVISQARAIELVGQIGDALLGLPRVHGVLPHFVRQGAIDPASEYASLDSVIALLSLLQARQSLGLSTRSVEQAIRDIDWEDLRLPDGTLSHGYTAQGEKLPGGWDTAGGESFLLYLAHAAARPGASIPLLPHPHLPTFNGSGFIDEIAWQLVPAPARDVWGNDWASHRRNALEAQLDHARLGEGVLFGVSAGEVPEPWSVARNEVYVAFGLGGLIGPDDGSALFGQPVFMPHYPALVAGREPFAALAQWDYLRRLGTIGPGNVTESIYLTERNGRIVPVWNALKGSLNLAFQALGYGQALLGDLDYPAYQAARSNPFLANGLARLTARPSTPTSVLLGLLDRHAISDQGPDRGQPIVPLYRDHFSGGVYGAIDDVHDVTLDANDPDTETGPSALRMTWNGTGASGYFQFGLGSSVANRPRDVVEFGQVRALRFRVKGDSGSQQLKVNLYRSLTGGGFDPTPIVSRVFALSTSWTDQGIDLDVPGGLTPRDLHAVQFLLGDGLDAGNRSVLLDEVRLVTDGADPLRILSSYVAQPGSTSAAPDSPSGRDALVYPNRSFLYDDALAIKALLASNEPAALQAARDVANAILATAPDGLDGYRNARNAGHVLQGDGTPRPAFGPMRTLGDNAWFGLALVDLFQLTGDPVYLTRALEISDWAESQLKATGARGGYRGGFDDAGEPFLWRATEHNIDFFQLETHLARILARQGNAPGAALHAARASHAGDFVLGTFDANEGKFWTGTGNDDTINTDSVPLDAQLWALLTLRLAPQYAGVIDWSRPLAWAESHLVATDAGLTGFTYSNRATPGRVWFEGVGQGAVLHRLLGDRAKWQQGLAVLSHASADGLGVRAASNDGLRDDLLGAVYDGRPAAAATAWHQFALLGRNPFDLFELARDDFARADGSDLGPDWHEALGDPRIVSNHLAGTAAVNLALHTGFRAADVAIEAAVAVPASNGSQAGLVLRHNGPADRNYYLATLGRENGAFVASIWRNLGGTLLRLGLGLVSTGTGVLRFQAVGSSLRLFLDGAPIVSANDGLFSMPGLVGTRGTAGATFAAFRTHWLRSSLPSLRASDTFSRPDGPDQGPAYVETAGNMSLVGGRLVGTAALNHTLLVNSFARDVSARVDVAIPKVGNSTGGLTLRYAGPRDSNTYYGALSSSLGSPSLAIWRNRNGIWTRLAFRPVTLHAGLLAFEATGNLLRLSLNGTLLLSVVDGALLGPGMVGLRGSAGASFDNLVVTPTASVMPVVELFDRPDDTHPGKHWSERIGNVHVQDQALVGAQNLNLATYIGATISDVRVRAEVRLPGAGIAHAGLVARSTGPGDTNAYVGQLMGGNGSFTAVIWRNLGGRWTRLGSAPAPGGSGMLAFEVVGNTLKLELSGTLLLAVEDAALTGPGLVGVRGSAGVSFDNFAADLSGSALPHGDGFDRADTSNLGGPYVELAGNLAIQGGRLIATAPGVNLALYRDASLADVRLQADVALTIPGSTAGLVARHGGPLDDDFYLAVLTATSGGGGTAALMRYADGVWTTLLSAPVATTTGTLRFELLGDASSLYLNDALVVRATDSRIRRPGLVGVRGSVTASWDNLRVGVLVADHVL